MHKQRLAVVIAAGLGIISTMLPWMEIISFNFGAFGSYGGNISGISTVAGILTFLGCAGAGVFAFLGDDRNKPIEANFVKFVAICGGVALLMVLLFILGSFSVVKFGAFIGLIAAAGIVAVPFVIKDDGEFSMPTKESIKDEFNEIKDN